MIRIRRVVPQEVSDLHRRMEQVMDSLLHGLGPAYGPKGFVPRADIHETPEGLLVTVDLPGVSREAIDIVVEGQALRISGVRPEPAITACLRWHQLEIAYGPFERFIPLPASADVEKIQANYKDGVLRLTLPTKEEAKPKQIAINVAK
jgi:HSP20 family protein